MYLKILPCKLSQMNNKNQSEKGTTHNSIIMWSASQTCQIAVPALLLHDFSLYMINSPFIQSKHIINQWKRGGGQILCTNIVGSLLQYPFYHSQQKISTKLLSKFLCTAIASLGFKFYFKGQTNSIASYVYRPIIDGCVAAGLYAIFNRDETPKSVQKIQILNTIHSVLDNAEKQNYGIIPYKIENFFVHTMKYENLVKD